MIIKYNTNTHAHTHTSLNIFSPRRYYWKVYSILHVKIHFIPVLIQFTDLCFTKNYKKNELFLGVLLSLN